jgi:hypothetical protein
VIPIAIWGVILVKRPVMNGLHSDAVVDNILCSHIEINTPDYVMISISEHQPAALVVMDYTPGFINVTTDFGGNTTGATYLVGVVSSAWI